MCFKEAPTQKYIPSFNGISSKSGNCQKNKNVYLQATRSIQHTDGSSMCDMPMTTSLALSRASKRQKKYFRKSKTSSIHTSNLQSQKKSLAFTTPKKERPSLDM